MALAAVIRDDHSAPFFEASAEGRLLLRYSPSQDTWSDPAALVCATTQADDLQWREAAGTGHLVSWTIKPGRRRDDVVTPDTVIGIVELDEGPWLTLQFPDAAQADLAVGRAVRVGFIQPEDSEHLPVGYLA
ncbi:hypothetical protein BHE97_08780 [Aeromicrobium sp. PE09-221]|uniref:Zn-ribbon domain-containing OB-fold protein n=1 Tax=Aeromicrobium sp. PE09-221 TaxID=1898043 RepID=UPI000B3E940D|nr:OB-fold domain-containing protein [Aeromicrobium sp. PE09-221]OUZ10140.1 hypothetical protein BHE97_08780 [Aeromicrobium sp. PE09-221]